MTDVFYVLEGTLALRVGDETVEAGAGTFAAIPPGVVHTFSNPSDRPVRILNLFAPAGLERYLVELAELVARGEPLTSELMGELASRYDFEPVG